MSVCSNDNCNRDAYEDENECVLHCEKYAYDHDRDTRNILREFNSALIDYIVDNAFENNPAVTRGVTLYTVKEYLKVGGAGRGVAQSILGFSKSINAVFTGIRFPDRRNQDDFDYIKALRLIKSAYFMRCHISAHELALTNTDCFFHGCHFYNNWNLTSLPIFGNSYHVLYRECEFHKDVSLFSQGREIEVMSISLFSNCIFNNDLSFNGIDFREPVFSNADDTRLCINNFKISSCFFQGGFILNNYDIDTFYCVDTLFNSKYEFKKNIVNDFCVVNTNFSGISDSYETKFNKFKMIKNIFSEFTAFERCEFGFKNNNDKDLIATFTYVTFLSFINFRNTRFHSGLDVEDINIKESPNFLNTQIVADNCNRETFRIIKHSFDKVGNHIVANKYFAEEMIKYRQEIKLSGSSQEKIILFMNHKISNFGQSYFRPIGIAVITAIVFALFALGYEYNILYKIHPILNDGIRDTANVLNGLAKAFLPLSRFLKEGMEFVSLLFHMIFAGLIWQTIVAVKRHTRR